MLTTRGFLHITIAVNDIDRSTDFYRDVLGCVEVMKVPKMMSFMKSGNDLFVLSYVPSRAPSTDTSELNQRTTLFHHAFLVEPEQFDRAEEHYAALGIKCWNCSEFAHPTFPGRRHMYIHDPDGNGVEIATMIPSELETLSQTTGAIKN